MDNKLKEALSLDDISILDAKSTIEWAPKDPRELLLPYTEDTIDDMTSIDIRRKKSKEVYDGYTEISKKCEILQAEIESQCGSATITLNKATQLNVSDAVSRTFGTDGTQITFDMYKKALEQLHKLSDNNITENTKI